MTTLPYNVRKAQAIDGSTVYQPYLPAHPYIGCPAFRTRKEAVEYIANSCGFSYDVFQECQRSGRVRLCPESEVGRRYERACGKR